MIIMKFGGSSLATAERMHRVKNIIEMHQNYNPVVILSAMGKTTDDLISSGHAALQGTVDIEKIAETHLAALSELNLSKVDVEVLLDELHQLLKGILVIKELTPKTMDHLLSFGERLSVRIFSSFLCKSGRDAKAFDSWEAGLVTTSDFNRAEPLPESYSNISKAFSQVQAIPIVTGFIAKDGNGATTTMGRGGSDLTASIFGAALKASEIQIWKDVHGILTTDPKVFKEAFPVPSISFEEAAELAYFGAKVLHPQSILPAMKEGIPVRVKNSFDPEHPGTLIVSKASSNSLVTAITYKPSQALVHICSTRMLGQYGYLAKVFQIFADLKLSVDVIATSEVSISLTLENQEGLEELKRRLQEIATVGVQQGKTIVSLIGKLHPEILERSLSTLSKGGIEVQMISHGASHVNTSLVVEDSDATNSVRLLHEHFF